MPDHPEALVNPDRLRIVSGPRAPGQRLRSGVLGPPRSLTGAGDAANLTRLNWLRRHDYCRLPHPFEL